MKTSVFSQALLGKKHSGSLMNLLRNSISVLIMIVKIKWSVWAIFMLTVMQRRQDNSIFPRSKVCQIVYNIPECIVLGTELKTL